jgi:GTP cyclohydrolase IA
MEQIKPQYRNGHYRISFNGHRKHHTVEKIGETAQIQQAVRQFLLNIGEDPDRQGLQRTPERVARMYAELTAGYQTDPMALINDAMFDVNYSEMVVIKGIDFYSLCEHHLLPFYGQAHVAYIPNGRVIGLSKIPRIVEMFARRLQIQERMTEQIASFIDEVLVPVGVAVVVEGIHMCSKMRGVKNAHSSMTTSAMRGVFMKDPKTRGEFMEHINRRRFDD